MNGPTHEPPPPSAPLEDAGSLLPAVRPRVLEYLGGSTPEQATCVYLSRCDSGEGFIPARYPPARLDMLLASDEGLARSLADLESVLIHLDIEYVNYDDEAAAFTDAGRAFSLQEPVVEAIEELLLGWGIRPLHLVTGQGHHFVWRIAKNGPAARAIGGLGIWTTPELVRPTEPVFPHLGLIMEFFAHRIKRESAPRTAVPVEITARHVGFGRIGTREMVSIDVSEYGDPLETRMIRIPYTRYRKPWGSGLIERLGIEGRVPEIMTLPLHEMDVMQLLERRRDPRSVGALARRAGVAIPHEEAGTLKLAEAYLESPLRRFHETFYTAATPPPEDWPQRYGSDRLAHLPGCIRHVLDHANDLLLKPAGIQLVTRALLAGGWPPRDIAGLVRSKFEDPGFGWGQQWTTYDPVLRAEFYVRLFAGEVATGIDSGIDFNCKSQQEKGFCWLIDQACSLHTLASALYPPRNPNQPDP